MVAPSAPSSRQRRSRVGCESACNWAGEEASSSSFTNQASRTLDASSRTPVHCRHDLILVRRVQDLVREHYVFADRADDIAAALAGVALPDDPARAAEALTTTLQAASGDLHLRVRHYPEGVPPEQGEEAVRAHWSREARRTAGGVAQVRRLDGGTGLLEIAPMLPPPEDAAPYVVAHSAC